MELNLQDCSARSHHGFLRATLVKKICGVFGWRASLGNGMLGLTCVSGLVNRPQVRSPASAIDNDLIYLNGLHFYTRRAVYP